MEPPPNFTDVVSVALGNQHGLALRQGGGITGWGNDWFTNFPLELEDGGAVAVAAGDQRSYALKVDGTVVAWGSGISFWSGWSNISAIAARNNRVAGVTNAGSVLVSGGPPAPLGLTQVTKVAVGGDHLLALRSDQTVVAWGNNLYGQATVPAGLSGVIAVAAGGNHSLALKSDGTVVAWGAGSAEDPFGYGQSIVPAGLAGVIGIAAGQFHSLALKSDGTVVGWGVTGGTVTPPPGSGVFQSIVAGTYDSAGIVTPAPDVVVGQANRLVLPGMRHDFGVVTPGNSLTKTFVIVNQGSAPLTNISLAKSGLNAAQFTTTAVPATLNPGTNAQFNVTFTPGATGAYFAALDVLTNDPDQPVHRINLTGRTLLAPVSWPERFSPPVSIPPGLADVVEIDGKGDFAAALRSDGRLLAWGGDSERGYWTRQLEDPANPIRKMAMGDENRGILMKQDGSVWLWNSFQIVAELAPAGSTVVKLSAGNNHYLAQKADGTLMVWAEYNNAGQLNMPPGLNALAFSAGGDHSLAVRNDGQLVAWGDNSYGQCTIPPGLAGVVDVAAGIRYSLALKGDGTVVGWGDNSNGELDIPPGLTGVVALAAGNRSAALKSDGTVVTWGHFATPVPVTSGRAAAICFEGSRPMALVTPRPEIVITEAGQHVPDGLDVDFSWTPIGAPVVKTFTITNPGNITLSGISLSKSGVCPGDYSFTSPPATLEPGASSSFTVTFSPAAIGARPAILHIASNDPDENPYDIALVGRTPMSVTAWGWAISGQTDQPPGLGDVVALAAGYNHSLALRSNGTVVAWGGNDYGQATVPAGLTSVKAIAAGWHHSLALKSDGTVVAWGLNQYQILQIPPGLNNVKAIAAGGRHSVALKQDGSLVAWGLNVKGQSTVPEHLPPAFLIAAGYEHSVLAFVGDAGPAVAGFGSNLNGQADGHLLAPRALAAGDYHNLALLPDGTLFGWGRPLFITPTVPAGLSGVTAITCGIGYSGALKQDGTAVMWGNPPSGKTILPSNLGLLGGLTAGGSHALAMVSPMPDASVTYGINRADPGDTVPFGIAGNSGSEMKTFTVLNRGTLPLTGLALTLDGPDASRFSFTAPLQTALAVGASTTFTVTFQTTAGGTRNATLHLASNDPDENPYNLSLTGSTGLTPIQAWRQLWFGDTSPYGISANDSDPDGDSVINLMEFAFGTDPTQRISGLAPLVYQGPAGGGGVLAAPGQPVIYQTPGGGTSGLRALYLRRKDATAATLTASPRMSADLLGWVAPTGTPQIWASDATHELIALPFQLLPDGRTPRFFRLAVTIGGETAP
jgi:alpha-tubulin suppressor-like RCC1 family protein